MNPKSILILIPAYNEELNIAGVLQELLAMRLDADILVVNDGSTDRTKEVASAFPVTVLSHPCNLGYGAALQTGFRYAQRRGYAYCLQFDADGQHDALDVPGMIEAVRRDDADIVIGSRFLDRESGMKMGAMKTIAIAFFRGLIYRTTGKKISDPTSGFKGISHALFSQYAKQQEFPSDFPDADILIRTLLQQFQIKEIPVRMRPRELGVSMHSGLKPVMYMLKVLLSVLIVLLNDKLSRGRRAV
ncbi:glycosyltransferase family 2 protein [Paenibacillus sp.]|uniref:glycosyltransferase family 2 protein n=1 Tax=Paenibacillus sp. TaxID=58172 RepID=UPI0028121478|nr:glycosyltransferase family 2 protein [Paenibacillus sp.]